jgi:hypothetical protein
MRLAPVRLFSLACSLACSLAGLLGALSCGVGIHPYPATDGAPTPPPPPGSDAAAADSAPPRPPTSPPARPDGAAAVDATNPAVPPGPPPTDQLVIGGVAMPKEKIVVFLHIGHSNMAGRTNTPPEMRPFNFQTHPKLWAFTRTGVFQPAKEPLSGDYLTQGRAGPGMSILRTALAMAPDSVMVSIGRGQDGSRGGSCPAFRRGGLLYDLVMGPARMLKGKVTFGGIFSMLVLMEVYDKPNLPRSHECMEGVAADMRADLGDPDIPFLMSDWEMGATGMFDPRRPDAVIAREQLRVAQKNIARSAIIPTDGLPMSDDHHFDLNGYKIWAERAFSLIQQGGWATWTTE